jgi:hypothetical protein
VIVVNSYGFSYGSHVHDGNFREREKMDFLFVKKPFTKPGKLLPSLAVFFPVFRGPCVICPLNLFPRENDDRFLGTALSSGLGNGQDGQDRTLANQAGVDNGIGNGNGNGGS